MRKRYKVLFTPLAERDISGITDYIFDVLCAPQAAYDLLLKMDEAVKPLEEFPFAFGVYKDPAFSKLGYRVLPVEKYLLFYVVADGVVEVRRVLYARRNLPELMQP